MPQVPGIRPFKESDLAEEPGFDPSALCIFSAVNDSPQREALFSGRFLNERRAVCSAWSAAGRLGRRSLSTKCGSFHRNERGRCSGLYTEPG